MDGGVFEDVVDEGGEGDGAVGLELAGLMFFIGVVDLGGGRGSRCFCSGEDHCQAQAEDFSVGHGFWVGFFGFEELVEKIFVLGVIFILCTVVIKSVLHVLGYNRYKREGCTAVYACFVKPHTNRVVSKKLVKDGPLPDLTILAYCFSGG